MTLAFSNRDKISRELLKWAFMLLLPVMLGGMNCLPVYGMGGDISIQVGYPLPGKQTAVASAVDSQGNIIVIGYQGLSEGNDDYCVVKFRGTPTAIPAELILWNGQSTGQGNGLDHAMAVVVDDNDDVIVTGFTTSAAKTDIQTVKYSGVNGTVLWKHTYNGAGNDSGTALAVDANYVYVSGYTQAGGGDLDYIVLKYVKNSATADNPPLWITTYGGAADETASAIAIGDQGIVVTGLSTNGTIYDMETIRFDADKNWKWTAKQGSAAITGNKVVRIDKDGNVIAAGTVINSNKDIFIAKYNWTTGDKIWSDTFDNGYADEPSALALDKSTGDAYLTGYSWSTGTNTDIRTLKYSAAGTRIWNKSFSPDTADDNLAVDLVIDSDPDGELFVAGVTTVNGGKAMFQVVKYKKIDGTQLWQKGLNVTAGQKGRPVGVGMNKHGLVLLAGWTDTLVANDVDFYLIGFDRGILNPPSPVTAGTTSDNKIKLTWASQSDTHESFNIYRCSGWQCSEGDPAIPYATGVALDATSFTDNLAAADSYYCYRIQAFKAGGSSSHLSDPACGKSQYVVVNPPSPSPYTFNNSQQGADVATAVACGPDNRPVITGYSDTLELGTFDYHTVKLESDLQFKWADNYDSLLHEADTATCLAISSTGDIAVSGHSNLVYNSQDVFSVFTRKYAEDGTKGWQDQFNSQAGIEDTAVAMVADATGGFVILTANKYDQTNKDLYLVKYLANGTRAWPQGVKIAAVDIAGLEIRSQSSLALDSSGNIFFTGFKFNGTSNDIYTAKHDGSTGAKIWSDTYDGASHGDDRGVAIAIDPSGNPYVTGFTTEALGSKDIIVIKYDGTNSAAPRQLWTTPYIYKGAAGGDDIPVGIAVDRINGAYAVVAGTVLNRVDDNDLLAIRLAPNKDETWVARVLRPESSDKAAAMAMDLAGNVFVAGKTKIGTVTSAFAVELDTSGKIVNANLWAGTGGDAEASAVAVNSYGEAFIAGNTKNAGNNTDFLVFKMPGKEIEPPYPFTATATASTVSLSWIDSSTNESGFKIYRKDESCSASTKSFSLINSPSAGQIAWQDSSNIQPVSQYCYKIEAYNANVTSAQVTIQVMTLPSQPVLTLLATDPELQTRIDLAWTDVTGETGYRVERKTDNGSWTLLVDKGVNETTYSDTGLSSTSVYYYRVKALNNSGDSAYSVEKSLPGIPVITAAQLSSSSNRVTWAPATNASGYRLEQSELVNGPFSQVGGDITALSKDDTGIKSATAYYYRLKSYNASGESAYSDVKSSSTKLQTPASLTATATSTSQIFVGWTDTNAPPNGNETGYRVSYAKCVMPIPSLCTTNQDQTVWWGSWTNVDLAADSTNTVINSLDHGRTYKFYVTGALSGADSDASPIKITTTNLDIPSGLTATTFSNTEIDLTWSDIEGEDNYDIIMDGNPLNLALTYNTIQKRIGGLSGGHPYCFQLKAYNTIFSTTLTAEQCATTKLDPPVMTSATPAGLSRVELQWAPIAGASSIEVWRCTLTNQNDDITNPTSGWKSCGKLATIIAGAEPPTQYTDEAGLLPGNGYKYYIAYYAGAAKSAESNFKTATTYPPTPAGLTATAHSASFISLSWTNVFGETGYNVQYKQKQPVDVCSQDSFWEAGVTTATSAKDQYSNHAPTNLQEGKSYCFRVNATGAVNSPWSTPVERMTLLSSPTITITAGNASSLTMSWTAVTGAIAYKITRSDGVVFPDKQITDSPFTDSSLNSGTSYTYYVNSKNAEGNYSNTVGTATASTAPATPPVISMAGTATSVIRVSWGAVGGAASYSVLYKKKEPADNCSTAGFWDSGTSSATTNSLSKEISAISGEIWCAKVMAANSYGPTSYSAYEQAQTLLNYPATVTLLADVANTISANWTQVSGNNGYRLEYSRNQTSWTPVLLGNDENNNSISGLDPGVVYYVRVSTKNSNGIYGFTSPVVSKLTILSLLSAPTLTVASYTQINLQWTAVAGATSYKVWRREGHSGNYDLIAGAVIPTNYNDIGLKADTTYYYYLQTNEAGSGNGVVASAKTKALSTVSMDSAVASSSMQTTVNWVYNAGLCTPIACPEPDGFNLERKMWHGEWYRVSSAITGNIRSFSDTSGIQPDTTYTYRVIAYKGSETSDYSSNTVSVTTPAYNAMIGICTSGGTSGSYQLPLFISTPPTTGTYNVEYSYQAVVQDSDVGDNIFYALPVAPAGMTISQKGLVSYTPGPSSYGNLPVTISASDLVGNKAEQSFVISVAKVNLGPIISSSPVTEAVAYQAYSYQLAAIDPNGDSNLLYYLRTFPPGMTMSNSGLISWTPTQSQAGSRNVVVGASDGDAYGPDAPFTITVSPNLPPSFYYDSVPDTVAGSGSAWSYQPVCYDPEGDAVSYAATSMPAGMTITGSLLYWPSAVGGSYPITVTCSDRDSTAQQAFTLTVATPPATPTGLYCNSSTHKIGWNAVAPVNGHAIQYKVTYMPNNCIYCYGYDSGWISATFVSVYDSFDYATVYARDSVTLAPSNPASVPGCM